MKVSILTDNRTKKGKLLAEHGLSVFIEHDEGRILFDAGQTNVYCHNADRMGIDLSNTSYIVLSHGHYDHGGGLNYFPKADKMPCIYIQETAFKKKYSSKHSEAGLREVGVGWLMENNDIKHSIVFIQKATQISPHITLCGGIPRTNDFEELSPDLFVENENKMVLDEMKDEQMLVIDSENGLNIFLGCSHPGIINCLSHVLKLFPNKKINTLLAGMHLEEIKSERLDKTIEYFKKLDIQRLIPLHCTGIYAICEMKKQLGSRCLDLCAGDTVEI